MSPHWGVNKWIACLCESMCIHNIYICIYYRRSIFEGQLCSFDDTYIHIIIYVDIYVYI